MQKKFAITATILALAIPTAFIGAQTAENTAVVTTTETTTITNPTNNRLKKQADSEAISESMKEKREKFEEQKCKMIESRIQGGLGRYENNQRMNQQIYGKTQLRLERLASVLEKKGYKTGGLKSNLEILKQKIEKLNSDYSNLIDSLKSTSEFACTQTQADFVGKLGQSRRVHASILEDRQDIRDYIKNTIKPQFQAIRQEVQKKTPATPVSAE